MKRLLVLFLSLFMVVCFAACGGNSTPEGSGNGSSENEPFVPPSGNHNTPPDISEPDDEERFIVTLVADGKAYIPSIDMYAQWKSTADGYVYSAKFDKKGRATGPSNLDGEYYVTLSNVPGGYFYNPNIYKASNEQKAVEIELSTCFSVSSPGGDPNPDVAMTLNTGRIYRATINSATDKVWFNLPVCQVETFCDIVADDVNPTFKGYTVEGGGIYNVRSEQVFEGGGVSGNYTKNIKFEKNGDYAQHTFFCLSAESQSKSYPVTVDFQLTSISGGGGGGSNTPDASHDPTLLKILDMPGKFRYNYQDTNRELLGSRYKLFERGTVDAAGNEGDGYYHIYDSEANIYKEIIFAVLTKPCELLDIPLTSGMITNASSPINKYYKDYANKDGAHPVTEELRVALNYVATRETYFYDGIGYMESRGLRSLMEDQWLFCCGYYVVI